MLLVVLPYWDVLMVFLLYWSAVGGVVPGFCRGTGVRGAADVTSLQRYCRPRHLRKYCHQSNHHH